MIDKLTVTTVCSVHHNQKRPTYSKMWVDRLYAGIKRNLDIPFEFVCFSNDIQSDEYRIEPLTTNSWGWWNKLEQFKRGLFTGPVLSLDLDIVICKNLTDGLNSLPRNKLLMVKEPHQFRPGEYIENSSVVFWDGDYSFLFDNFPMIAEDTTFTRPRHPFDCHFTNTCGKFTKRIPKKTC
jgi:hypothetical protein